jgi:hypothetical protein
MVVYGICLQSDTSQLNKQENSLIVANRLLNAVDTLKSLPLNSQAIRSAFLK